MSTPSTSRCGSSPTCWASPGGRALFREFVQDLLEGINLPPDERLERVSRLFDYLLGQVHDHLDEPRDDLTTS